MRIVFFGTSEIAAGFLEFLNSYHQIVLVITVKPKPAGRGWIPKISAVDDFAQKNNLAVLPVDKFNEEVLEKIKLANPELGVVVDFGKIIPDRVFNWPVYKTINVHFSLLPRWRGAAPIQWALLAGDKETGVSIFYLEKSLDTGPLLASRRLVISDSDDAISLENKLAESGKQLLLETIENIEKKTARASPQLGEVTLAPSLTKEIGRIDWNKSAREIYNCVRALVRWPQAYTFYPGPESRKMLKILQSEVLTVCPGDNQTCPACVSAGVVSGLINRVGFVVKCGRDFLLVKKVLPQDKKIMSAWDFWQGSRLSRGVRLG